MLMLSMNFSDHDPGDENDYSVPRGSPATMTSTEAQPNQSWNADPQSLPRMGDPGDEDDSPAAAPLPRC
jgi:hypothetical protein